LPNSWMTFASLGLTTNSPLRATMSITHTRAHPSASHTASARTAAAKATGTSSITTMNSTSITPPETGFSSLSRSMATLLLVDVIMLSL